MAGKLNFDTDTIGAVKTNYATLGEENENMLKGIEQYIDALSGTGSKVIEDQLQVVKNKRDAFIKVKNDLVEPMEEFFKTVGNLDEFGNGGAN